MKVQEKPESGRESSLRASRRSQRPVVLATGQDYLGYPSRMRRVRLSRVLTALTVSGLLIACGDDTVAVTATASSSTSGGESSSSSSTTEDLTTASTGGSTTVVMTSTGHGSTSGSSTSPETSTGSNGQPIAHDDAFIAIQKQVFTVGALEGLLENDADGDGDWLTVVAADGVSARGGKVDVEELGGFIYQPPPEVWGEDSFKYTIWDGKDGFATATARIMVNPSSVDLEDVAAGLGGFAINGEVAGDYSGNWVDGLGSVDGDGYEDIVIGARFSDALGVSSGSAYVVFGKAKTDPVDLSVIGAGEQLEGLAIRGEDADDQAGVCVAGVGDVDGDGFADVMVGADQSEGQGVLAGRVYLVSGKLAGAPIALADVAQGVGGVVIDAEDKIQFAGHAVSSAGDVNGDGFKDLLIGAYGVNAQGTFSGRSYVIYGALSESIALAKYDGKGLSIDGEAELDFSGHALAGGGDINGDGLDDVIIGAYGADPNGEASGRVYVVYGTESDKKILLSEIAAGIGGFALDGEFEGDHAGDALAMLGDINGDGFADFAVGAPLADPNGMASGRVYVVHGGDSLQSRSLSELVSGDGGFIIDGETFRDYAGASIDGAGDVDGDGLDDVIIGAYGADPKGMVSGRAYLVFGKKDTDEVSLDAIRKGEGGFAFAGEKFGDQAGISVAGAGDVNGDGFADLLVGAFGSDIKGENSGRSYVFFGGDYSNIVDRLGSLGSQELIGSAEAEVMVAGEGSDTLRGEGGADVLYGGAGNDRIEIGDDGFSRIDGGTGKDTLGLSGSGVVLDLTAIADSSIRGIEVIDLMGGGNTLILQFRDMRRMIGTGRELTILGKDGDIAEVDLSSAGFVDLGEDGGFALYENPALTLRVAVAVDVTVTL